MDWVLRLPKTREREGEGEKGREEKREREISKKLEMGLTLAQEHKLS